MRRQAESNDRSLLVALTKAVPPKLEANPALRAALLGPRPPLLSDFFNETLALRVKLRKQRYEMHIKAYVVAVDDDFDEEEPAAADELQINDLVNSS